MRRLRLGGGVPASVTRLEARPGSELFPAGHLSPGVCPTLEGDTVVPSHAKGRPIRAAGLIWDSGALVVRFVVRPADESPNESGGRMR